MIAPVVGWDAKKQKVKVSPMARWTDEQVEQYILDHGVLVNPLVHDGYPSIGCWPCTRRVAPGDDPAQRSLGRHHQDRVRDPRMRLLDLLSTGDNDVDLHTTTHDGRPL